MRSEGLRNRSVLLKTSVTEWMSVDCMSPSIFKQPTLEFPTTFDVDFESMDSYFFAFIGIKSNSASDPQHFSLSAPA